MGCSFLSPCQKEKTVSFFGYRKILKSTQRFFLVIHIFCEVFETSHRHGFQIFLY